MVAVGDPIILAMMPGYEAGVSTYTSDSSTFTTTETEIASITVSLINGVTYDLRCDAHISSSTAGDTVTCRIREDNSSGTEVQVVSGNTVSTSGNRPVVIPVWGRYTATATGSKTFSVTAVRQAGGGNIFREVSSVAPMIFTVKVAA